MTSAYLRKNRLTILAGLISGRHLADMRFMCRPEQLVLPNIQGQQQFLGEDRVASRSKSPAVSAESVRLADRMRPVNTSQLARF